MTFHMISKNVCAKLLLHVFSNLSVLGAQKNSLIETKKSTDNLFV